eukprot:TRINITY_DN125227_c0_g1_i1.p2 TRINITY_DN125227_c0_g1~~TRINITY_DN125227_c0_g1_i1.p2  ORF type:complete len:190 (+),score=29.98 TRINITY_DN125227_c0_g1_i1:104-673(+)
MYRHKLAAALNKSGAYDGSLAGGLGERRTCSLRQHPSAVDPAGFEHYVELMRQGTAGALRTQTAARVLANEAHKQGMYAKAIIGAMGSVLDDPERLYTGKSLPDFGFAPATPIAPEDMKSTDDIIEDMKNFELPKKNFPSLLDKGDEPGSDMKVGQASCRLFCASPPDAVVRGSRTSKRSSQKRAAAFL